MPKVGYFGRFWLLFIIFGYFLKFLSLAERLEIEYGNDICREHYSYAKKVYSEFQQRKLRWYMLLEANGRWELGESDGVKAGLSHRLQDEDQGFRLRQQSHQGGRLGILHEQQRSHAQREASNGREEQ